MSQGGRCSRKLLHDGFKLARDAHSIGFAGSLPGSHCEGSESKRFGDVSLEPKTT